MARSHSISGRVDVVTHSARRSINTARAILKELFGPYATRDFAVRYWDGTWERPNGGGTSAFTLVIRRPGALRRIFLPPSELNVIEAYLRDDYDIEGDVVAAAGLADQIAGRVKSPVVWARLASQLLSLPADDAFGGRPNGEREAPSLFGRVHSRKRDADAVRYHYDTGNEFYSLWLDKHMAYSCAYFATGDETLDDAQEAKFEHICRKLRLQSGERLLDIGCGWGGLVIYAARHYGVQATGITLSEPQASLARQFIAQAGLADRCQVEVRDYRDMPRGLTFDKVVSVGMHEHVGGAMLDTYFAEAFKLTKPGGLFLNHGIVLLRPDARGIEGWVNRHVWREGEFIERYVFPDSDLLPPARVIGSGEAAGFETRDVESLREHYALTLRHWVRRLESAHDAAARLAGEKKYRVWRMYTAGASHSFEVGKIGVIQTLFSKSDTEGRSHLPRTRADIYAG
jgi:cyclopropane-fatty-acyl-phospholipid synthase